MAQLTTFRASCGEPTVTEFTFNEELLKNTTSLKIKVFDTYDNAWAEFILLNRQNESDQQAHDYDIVIGPIADDTVGVQIRRFSLGYINIETLVKELSFIRPTFQYFFGTTNAIKLLTKHG